MQNNQSGNVLFLILIAVALFAALSYAVTQSSRSGSGNTSKENMELAYSTIQNTIIAHRQAIQRMAFNGILTGELDASAGSNNLYLYVNNQCTRDECHIYLPKGGGVSFFTMKSMSQYAGPDLQFFPSGGKAGLFWSLWARAGTDKADLLLRISVTKDFCDFYNQKLGNDPVDSSDPIPGGIYHVSGSASLPLDVATNGSSNLDANWSGVSFNDGISSATNPGSAKNLKWNDNGCGFYDGQYVILALIWAR